MATANKQKLTGSTISYIDTCSAEQYEMKQDGSTKYSYWHNCVVSGDKRLDLKFSNYSQYDLTKGREYGDYNVHFYASGDTTRTTTIYVIDNGVAVDWTGLVFVSNVGSNNSGYLPTSCLIEEVCPQTPTKGYKDMTSGDYNGYRQFHGNPGGHYFIIRIPSTGLTVKAHSEQGGGWDLSCKTQGRDRDKIFAPPTWEDM